MYGGDYFVRHSWLYIRMEKTTTKKETRQRKLKRNLVTRSEVHQAIMALHEAHYAELVQSDGVTSWRQL